MRPTAVHVRPAAVAGAFYPADRGRLASLVDGLLAEASRPIQGSQPVALVVPHAGYAYSGAVAATAYAGLRRHRQTIRRVAIIGPAHFVRLRGVAVPEADVWATPLGELAIDAELRDLAIAAGAVVDDRPHAPEHSIEVQLPFLQRVLPDGPSILPIAVIGLPAEAVADLIGRLRQVADLLIVSTDLSHEQPDDVARRLDRRTLHAAIGRDPSALEPDAACGFDGLRGVVELARRERLDVTVLDQRTSAEAGGGTGSVVGYAAVAIG